MIGVRENHFGFSSLQFNVDLVSGVNIYSAHHATPHLITGCSVLTPEVGSPRGGWAGVAVLGPRVRIPAHSA